MFFNAGGRKLKSMFGSDSKYWSEAMKEALRLADNGGFPYQLARNKSLKNPVPAVAFSERVKSVGGLLNKEQWVYVTPVDNFTALFRVIFTKTQIKHTTGKESREWLAGPNMRYLPQQLNFALWCATTACWISRDILLESGMD